MILGCAIVEKPKIFMAAVEMAGMSRDLDNDKHPHQFRVPNNVLRKFTDRLLRQAESMLRCKNFEQLHELVASCRVKGIGILTIYDTAQRVGANMRIEPRRVYLHQGTRLGAERYFKRTLSVDSVNKREFREFSKLSCSAIEDVMCIYKDEFPLTKNPIRITSTSSKC